MQHLRAHARDGRTLQPPKQVALRLAVAVATLGRALKRDALLAREMCGTRHGTQVVQRRTVERLRLGDGHEGSRVLLAKRLVIRHLVAHCLAKRGRTFRQHSQVLILVQVAEHGRIVAPHGTRQLLVRKAKARDVALGIGARLANNRQVAAQVVAKALLERISKAARPVHGDLPLQRIAEEGLHHVCGLAQRGQQRLTPPGNARLGTRTGKVIDDVVAVPDLVAGRLAPEREDHPGPLPSGAPGNRVTLHRRQQVNVARLVQHARRRQPIRARGLQHRRPLVVRHARLGHRQQAIYLACIHLVRTKGKLVKRGWIIRTCDLRGRDGPLRAVGDVNGKPARTRLFADDAQRVVEALASPPAFLRHTQPEEVTRNHLDAAKAAPRKAPHVGAQALFAHICLGNPIANARTDGISHHRLLLGGSFTSLIMARN